MKPIILIDGGVINLTNNDELGKPSKHITTTAKGPRRHEFVHDMKT